MTRLSEPGRMLNRVGSRVSLRAKRIDLDLTLEEASKLIGISKYSLYNYEKYKTIPNIEVAKKIAKAYRVDIDSLRFAPDDTEVISSKKMKK